MANEKTAFDPSDRAAEIARRAQLPRDLFGGTEAMRARGIEYLPKWPLEPADAWAARKNSTFLSPGYKQAVQTAVGKAFGDSIVLHEDVPLEIRGSEGDDNGPAIEGLWENIDNTGNHGDTFAQSLTTQL